MDTNTAATANANTEVGIRAHLPKLGAVRHPQAGDEVRCNHGACQLSWHPRRPAG